ncbi:HAMP domain-containing histidine kinase [Microcoleus sp. FACHB-1515]|uniref:sensor histidine kinase n=1 Tax=Cyanophyceae TaxID=3028117 RepID=UPI0016824F53|nr:HAMP domain-containing sensor histidine kinase [Microcoleus sp. FACHB-1515]MBD2089904.1 HAMP domain-containing histidine kinase [Microcoleus sp. FACHB-1515]
MDWSKFLYWGVGLGMGWLLSKRLQPTRRSPVATDAIAQLDAQPAYRMAIEMERFKATFLAKTSHELRSPLNSIISLHQLILSDLSDSPEEEREFVAQAQAAAQKMLSRLDEVISVSKVQAGTVALELQPVQLSSLFEEVRSLTYLQAQNRSLRLEFDRPDRAIYVTADPRWLRQILLHLVTNAIATMREGTIQVAAQASPATKTAQITVTDDRPASTEPVPETGLNLMIDQLLLEQMQGGLEQTIEPAYQIRCTLPLAQPPIDRAVANSV